MNDLTTGYRNSDGLTEWVKRMLYLQILVASISIISNVMEYSLLSDFASGAYISEEQAVIDAEANDQRQAFLGFLYLGVFFVSGFLILRWIHRANFNARQLGALDMEFTPGWSIGYYFIPILTLWKPYQAMKEIWKASHHPKHWKNENVPSLLGWWWFLWIATNLIGQAIFRLSMRAEEISELQLVNALTIASNAIDIPLAIVLLKIVSVIYDAQKTAFRHGT